VQAPKTFGTADLKHIHYAMTSVLPERQNSVFYSNHVMRDVSVATTYKAE